MVRFGLGLVCLIVVALQLFTALALIPAQLLVNDVPKFTPVFPLVLALLFATATALLWRSAYRNAAGGPELFTGDRGLLVSLMIICTVALAVLMVIFMLQPDAWRGFFDGLRD